MRIIKYQNATLVIDKHFTLDEPVTNGKKIKQINNVKTLLHISDINFLWYYAHKRRTMQESTTTITPSRELWGSRLTLTVTLALIYYSSLVRTNASEPIDEPDIKKMIERTLHVYHLVIEHDTTRVVPIEDSDPFTMDHGLFAHLR